MVRECRQLSAKWQQLSAFLGLAKADIDRIKEDHPNNSNSCWNEALDEWIKQNYSTDKFGLPSWRTLVTAVSMVDKRLFKELAFKYQITSMCCILVLNSLSVDSKSLIYDSLELHENDIFSTESNFSIPKLWTQ